MQTLSKEAGFEHPKDGFYMIEPAGEHLTRDGSRVVVIDEAAIASIVENFNAAAQDPNFSGMLIDHEHFKHDLEKETIAYGWLMGLQGRADGIYGQIRWTATGRAVVDGGDYRFFSTEYDPADLEVLSDDEPRRVRPLKLDGLTLTNAPNNKGGKPITNRGACESDRTATPEEACRAFGLIVNRKRALLKCDFENAWRRASAENPRLFAAMHNRQRQPVAAAAANRATRMAAVAVKRIAGEMILNIARREQAEQGGGFDRHWRRVCNRRPGLVRILNGAGDAGWLAGLESTAHAEYMKAAQGDALANAVANPDSRKFCNAMNTLAAEFPELGFEGRWEKMRELCPALFWRFVLTFAAQEEGGK